MRDYEIVWVYVLGARKQRYGKDEEGRGGRGVRREGKVREKQSPQKCIVVGQIVRNWRTRHGKERKPHLDSLFLHDEQESPADRSERSHRAITPTTRCVCRKDEKTFITQCFILAKDSRRIHPCHLHDPREDGARVRGQSKSEFFNGQSV